MRALLKLACVVLVILFLTVFLEVCSGPRPIGSKYKHSIIKQNKLNKPQPATNIDTLNERA